MPNAVAESIALIALAAALLAAIVRPRNWGEAVVAVPAATVVVLTGVVPAHDALDRIRQIGPTVAFLAAILVLGHLCARAGVFDYLGEVAARHGGRPVRLLTVVVVIAAAVTTVLTLDATVVLLTPVVLRTARALRDEPRPHLYACARLANSGSLLLPISNLTNLLAFTAAGLSFGRFAALMALPWLVAVAGEWASLRWFFRADLTAKPAGPTVDRGLARPVPRYALTVLSATVVLFVLSSSGHIAPAWAAAAGAIAMLFAPGVRRSVGGLELVRSASIGFCLFVLALAVVVEAVTRHGLHTALAHALPGGTGLLALLGVAFLAAALANVVNNLPATLALIPLVAASPATVLAVLLGVNIGPNASYGGSLATLLWRRLLPEDQQPRWPQFHRFGVLSTPVVLVGATLALWAAVSVVGLH